MRVILSPQCALGVALLLCLDPGGLVLPLLAAVFFHESGHLLALAICRVPVQEIRFGFFGASIRTGVRGQRQELFCAAAGPAANGVICALSFGKSAPVFAVNLWLAISNLLPLYLLDGGRALFALLPAHAPQIQTVILVFLLLLSGYAAAVWHLGLPCALFCLGILFRMLQGKKNCKMEGSVLQ